MFDKRRCQNWKSKIRKIINNIQNNSDICYNKQLIDPIVHSTINNTIIVLYNILDKMNNFIYLYLYKKVYLFYIFPQIKKLIFECGTIDFDDINYIFGSMLNDDYKSIIKYLFVYKTEIVSQSPEIDEELKLQYWKRKAFFWNSYPPMTKSIVEQIHGTKVYIPLNKDTYLVCYGVFHENSLLYLYDHKYICDKHKNIDLNDFQKKYLRMLSVKDYLVNDEKLFEIILTNAVKDYEKLKIRQIGDIQKELPKLNILKQRKYVILLLCSANDDDKIKAKVLYDNLKCPYMPLLSKKYLNQAYHSVNTRITEFDSVQETNYKEKIVLLKVDDNVKQKAFEKLRDVNSGREISSKAQQYIDGLLKIPFGTYLTEPIFQQFNFIQQLSKNEFQNHSSLKKSLENTEFSETLQQFDIDKKIYMENVRTTLNSCVHGHSQAKTHIERLIGQWIHGKMNGTVFGFQGPPGTGKTTLAKNGFAKCLLDNDGNTRPIAFLPIGGSSGSSFLEGHGYTYMGSSWGRVVDILMEQRCMNPIIYIDELDKISMSERGQEINGILIHLTDPSQNKEFSDKYFSGIKFDLSKAIIIFSYNDASKVDRILQDRITEIKMSPLSRKDKLIITDDFMIPEILEEIGFCNTDIIFEENIIEYLIDTYTNEAGVRKLKELLYTVLREVNIKYLKDDVTLPYKISHDFVKSLFIENPKNLFTKIDKHPSIGKVNGLFANTQGIGGITIIEVHETPSDDNLSLILTGSQGDVMKESMKCAKTLAWNLLSESQRQNVSKSGLHIHCPMGSTPKDGPSAGCAITLAIYSRLTKQYIKNNVAMTGEIDLDGNLHAIGGLEAKLFGALRANVTHVYIPEENHDEYNVFISKYPEYPIIVQTVSNIHKIIESALLSEKEK